MKPHVAQYRILLNVPQLIDSYFAIAESIKRDALERKRAVASEVIAGEWLIVQSAKYLELIVQYGNWCDRIVARGYTEISLADAKQRWTLPENIEAAQLSIPVGFVPTEWLHHPRQIGLDIDADLVGIWDITDAVDTK